MTKLEIEHLIQNRVRDMLAGTRERVALLEARTTGRNPLPGDRWDRFFMGKAEANAGMSKDSSTKVGAVAVRDRRAIAEGFNGYPPGVPDVRLDDREYKLPRIVHAEENVIGWAARCGVPLAGATLYVWPWHPCARCARLIATAGIVEVVVPPINPPGRWHEDYLIAAETLEEAGVAVRVVEP